MREREGEREQEERCRDRERGRQRERERDRERETDRHRERRKGPRAFAYFGYKFFFPQLPGEEVVGSTPTVFVRSLMVGAVSV